MSIEFSARSTTLKRQILFLSCVFVGLISGPCLAVTLYPDDTAAAIQTSPVVASKSVSVSVPIVATVGATANTTAKVSNSSVKYGVAETSKQTPLLNWLKFPQGSRNIKDPFRKAWVNLESVIARGDLRFGYEIPADEDWTGILEAHVNPSIKQQNESGDVGILGGARYYLDTRFSGPFMQFLGGFNHEDGLWAMGVQLAAGYAIPWKKTTGFEFGLLAQRFFGEQEDAKMMAFVSFTFGLDRKLAPFL
jgi:hypothetical protein